MPANEYVDRANAWADKELADPKYEQMSHKDRTAVKTDPAKEHQWIAHTCGREKIHTPGSIQPHGYLLVMKGENLTVTQYSANFADLGYESNDLLYRYGPQQPIATPRHSPASALSCKVAVFMPASQTVSTFAVVGQPPPPPSRKKQCTVAMTICLCHGGMCEPSIRCSWPPVPESSHFAGLPQMLRMTEIPQHGDFWQCVPTGVAPR